ncbi:hypothetical protein IJ707_01135 [bacterium]|nr:hypothetical protein [bacterium]
MQNFYYDLSGGINQASTKTELGFNTKKIFWSDSKNMEIYQNKGIVRQKGNVKFLQLPVEEAVIGIHEMKEGSIRRLLIATESGKLYIYDENDYLIQLDKTITSKRLLFTNFLNGILVAGDSDEMFFVKKSDSNYEFINCNLKRADNSVIYPDVVAIHKGRVWVADGATLYFSALGRYDDFSTSNDAGYINNFYTDTDNITALSVYQDHLAIYKEKSVYLLSGSSPVDFSITLFADKGAYSPNGVVTVNNKQYFYCSGIYTLEVGALNQILLGSEITDKIKDEFNKFDYLRRNETFAINYEEKNQVWYFIPYINDKYFHTIWINDIVNQAWYKRVLPQDITSACIFHNYIVTADDKGNLYKENINNSFDGKPIEFMWKSPFLGLGDPTIRKTIDEFYFILDEAHENNFNFSVFKNFDSENRDDVEKIYSNNYENLVWYKENLEFALHDSWSDDEDEAIWAMDTESQYKAEISEANYSIQICIDGDSLEQNAAVIGIQFKEIFNED